METISLWMSVVIYKILPLNLRWWHHGTKLAISPGRCQRFLSKSTFKETEWQLAINYMSKCLLQPALRKKMIGYSWCGLPKSPICIQSGVRIYLHDFLIFYIFKGWLDYIAYMIEVKNWTLCFIHRDQRLLFILFTKTFKFPYKITIHCHHKLSHIKTFWKSS